MRNLKLKEEAFEKFEKGQKVFWKKFDNGKKYKSLMSEKTVNLINELKTKSMVVNIDSFTIEEINSKKYFKVVISW